VWRNHIRYRLGWLVEAPPLHSDPPMQPPPPVTTVLLARHGETTLNVEGRFRGRADPPLTVGGVAQARALAHALAGWRPTAILASPRRRAVQTAAEIASAVSQRAEIDPRLDDIDYGEWTGLSHAEVAMRWADDLTRWEVAPDTLTLPRGEAVAQVAARIGDAVADAALRFPGKSVVLVTHDVTIRLMLCYALTAPLAGMHRICIGLASLTALTLGSGVVIERVNDQHHLAAPEAAPGTSPT
jgi:broad specificity phosphatase PhoE